MTLKDKEHNLLNQQEDELKVDDQIGIFYFQMLVI